MSFPYSIQAGSRVYTVVDDITSVYSAVITGAVTDEILGDFLSAGFTVQVSRGDLGTRTTERGLYAITAYPDLAFPKLSSTSYTVDLTLQAPGFQDAALQVTIPQNATFPVQAPAVALRRRPVRIQGRVVQDSNRQAISGAWVVAVDQPHVPPPPTHATLLRSPLYFVHPINTVVQQVNLMPAGSTQLALPAPAGTQVLNLNNTSGLAGTAFIQLSTPSLAMVEYATVHHLGLQPGMVFLRNPLNRSYAAGNATNVKFFTATAGASSGKLTLDAQAGDGLVVADQLLNVGTVVVDPTFATSLEYHEIGAISDSDGYYSFDGIGRVQELFLQANPQVPHTPVITWFIEYDQPVNVVDFRL